MMTVQVACGCGCGSVFNMQLNRFNGEKEIAPSWFTPTPFLKEDKREIYQYLKNWKNRGGKIDRIIVKFI